MFPPAAPKAPGAMPGAAKPMPPAPPKVAVSAPGHPEPDGDEEGDHEGVMGALHDALEVVAQDPEMQSALKTAKTVTFDVKPNGDIDVDVDGTKSTALAAELKQQDAGDMHPMSNGASPPPAPKASAMNPGY